MSVDRKEKRVKLTLKNISKSFYARKEIFEAVSNISIDVYENEFLVILGPGQCGKSVLLNMISGLEEPTAGEVMFPNNDEKKVGFVFQKTAVFPWKTVMQNVEFSQELKGVNKAERRKQAEYLIELVGLKGFENSYPRQLSGEWESQELIAVIRIFY